MKEVVNNLQQNNVNPETIKKQERILSRLLDASKSMRERDYEKKRKAETGTQITRKSPDEIDLNSLEGKDRLREELLKALEEGYSKDYQELIRKYFEELEKTDGNTPK
jgi:predicted acetyltransferase